MVIEAEGEPEQWWAANGTGDLGYASLLAGLAPTAAARQGLLEAFFEPTDEDREQGLKVPSAAHRAIATLVKRGSVRVIITTNFDRLMERELESVVVSPQVIARPEAVNGMAPLAHAKATVIKLHGDYADLGMRNTPEELGTYPDEWNRLLDQVLDEYGLLVAGWSADWDAALVAAMERSTSRRYPLYWDSRSSNGAAAQHLLAFKRGVVVPAESADALFVGLQASVETFDGLAEPPLTTAMSVSRLKRYLPDPVRRIDLYDLVKDATDRVVQETQGKPNHVPGLDVAELERVLAGHLTAVTPLLHLLVEGVRHDVHGVHDAIWIEVLTRLLSARQLPFGTFTERLWEAKHYPALLALQAAGVTAVRYRRDGLLVRLATEVTWRSPHHEQSQPAAQVLHVNRVLDHNTVNGFTRWEGNRWLYPQSHLLRADTREALRAIFPADEDFGVAVDDYEYRLGLLQELNQGAGFSYRGNSGEFVGERQWSHDEGVRAERRLRNEAATADDAWPWWDVVGGKDRMNDVLLAYRELLRKYERWG